MGDRDLATTITVTSRVYSRAQRHRVLLKHNMTAGNIPVYLPTAKLAERHDRLMKRGFTCCVEQLSFEDCKQHRGTYSCAEALYLP